MQKIKHFFQQGISPVWAVVVIVAIATLIAMAFLLDGYFWQSKQAQRSIQNNIFSDETTDWKTYENEEYGFEIKYPSSYAIATSNCYNWKKDEKLNDEKSIIIGDQEKISVHICYFNGNASDFFGQEKFIPITIGGRSAFKNEFEIRGGGRGWYYIQKDNSNVIFIDANWAYSGVYPNTIADEDFNKRKQTIDQMLSNFKFIHVENKASGIVEKGSDAKDTYRDEEYSFTIRYPSKYPLGQETNLNPGKAILTIIPNENLINLECYKIQLEKIFVTINESENSESLCSREKVFLPTSNQQYIQEFSSKLTEQGWQKEMNINGITFYRRSSSESSMGGKNDARYYYQTFQNGKCYEVGAQISSSSSFGFADNCLSPEIRESFPYENIDKEGTKAIQDIFLPIFYTFEFLE